MSDFDAILIVGLAAVAIIIILGFGTYFLYAEHKSDKENMRLLEACHTKPYVSRRMTELHKTGVQTTPSRNANSGGGESASTQSGYSDATTAIASQSDNGNCSDYSSSDSTSGGSDSCSSGE